MMMAERGTQICNVLAAIIVTATWAFVAADSSVTHTVPVQKERMKMDKETLAKRVGKTNPDVAEKIRAERSTIDDVETPFFRNGSIHRVVYPSPYRPITFVFGLAGKDFEVPLAKNPNGFFELARRAGLDLTSESLRLSYVEAFLESTRDFQSRFQIIRKFDDIVLINQPTEDEKKHYADLKSGYEGKIKPPEISGQGPWIVKLFVLKRQDLVFMNLELSEDGSVKSSDETLEKDLPIAEVK